MRIILIIAVIAGIVGLIKFGKWIYALGLFFFASLLFSVISLGKRRFSAGIFWLFLSIFSGLILAHQTGRVHIEAIEVLSAWKASEGGFWVGYLHFMNKLTGSYGWGAILTGIFLQILLLPIHAKQKHRAEVIRAIHSKLIGRSPKSQMEIMRESGVNPFIGCFTLLFLFAIFIGIWYSFVKAFRYLSLSGITPAFFWIPDLTKPYGWPPLLPWYAYTSLSFIVAFVSWLNMRIKESITGINPPKVNIFLTIIFVGSLALFLPSGASLFIIGAQIGEVIVYFILITPKILHKVVAVFRVRSLSKKRPEQEQQIPEALLRFILAEIIKEAKEKAEKQQRAEPPVHPVSMPEEEKTYVQEAPPVFFGHVGAVRGIVTISNNRLLSAGDDGSLRWWDTDTGECLKTVRAHDSPIIAISVLPDLNLAVTTSANGELRLWNLQNLSYLNGFDLNCRIKTLTLSPLGVLAVVAVEGFPDLHMFNVESGKLVRTLKGSGGEIASLAFSRDGRSIISGHSDGALHLWDLGYGQITRTFAGHDSAISSVVFHPEGKQIISGGKDRTVKIWDRLNGEFIRGFMDKNGAITAISLSPDGRWVACGNERGMVYLVEISTGKPSTSFGISTEHRGSINGLSFSIDGRFLFSAGDDGTIRRMKIE